MEQVLCNRKWILCIGQLYSHVVVPENIPESVIGWIRVRYRPNQETGIGA
jgi:hypothetical protein